MFLADLPFIGCSPNSLSFHTLPGVVVPSCFTISFYTRSMPLLVVFSMSAFTRFVLFDDIYTGLNTACTEDAVDSMPSLATYQ